MLVGSNRQLSSGEVGRSSDFMPKRWDIAMLVTLVFPKHFYDLTYYLASTCLLDLTQAAPRGRLKIFVQDIHSAVGFTRSGV